MRKDFSFNNLGDLVNHSLKKMDLEHKTRERTALSVWSGVVGNRIAKVTSAEMIRDGVLFVGCSSATWANELTFLKAEIIEKLNRKLGGSYVKDIRFSTRSKLEKHEEEPAEEDFRIPEKELKEIRISDEEQARIDQTALEAGDEELAQRIRRAMITYRKTDEWKLAHGWKRCSSCGLLFEEGKKVCPACRK